jgi:hypothetical protein
MNFDVKLAKKIAIIVLIVLGSLLALSIPAYFLTRYFVTNYFEDWGQKLVNLEKKGLLSREYGAGWQDVLTGQEMDRIAAQITEKEDIQFSQDRKKVAIVDGVVLADYPSLSIIDRLREVKAYSNVIEIVDRNNNPLSTIKTDHLRATINEFPPVLVNALIAAEDGTFRKNRSGFEFDSFARAALRAVIESITKFRKVSPRGTSTITQQVAKLFISRLDDNGMRRVSRSVDRKIRELRLAAALQKMYTPEDILEVYLNHCVTSDYGMIGYKDIARGLFNCELNQLTDAQCVYLARMVKWGRNIKKKIVAQCRIDMPRMGKTLGWDETKQNAVLTELDTISFAKVKKFQGGYGSLVDLANEYWFKVLRMNGMTEDQIVRMDLIDPNSLVRKKGNLKIQLTIDLPLQKELETLVNGRGYGPDTTIITDIRIGSTAEVVTRDTKPKDSLRFLTTLKEPMDFKEPGSMYITSLNPGDSVIANIRYKKSGKSHYRRSCFYYVRKPVVVNGQYFAYSIMDSHSGQMRAYYSKDRIGSKLNCLLGNRTPNGSSTAKPILNALNYDLGVFKPWSKWTDSIPVSDMVPWKRDLDFEKGKMVGVVFQNSAVRGVGYQVHNHGSIFEGCNYIFNLLATSNNILGVETVYRLNNTLFDKSGDIIPDAFQTVQLLYRIGAFSRVKDSLRLTSVTGVRVYKELCRIVGVEPDSMVSYGRKMAVSDSMYSVALGTLEMNLYEQMHLFNVLYNNDLIENPAEHPSLVIGSIILNGDTVAINDTIKKFHPFADINSIQPTKLGLHKRLLSNRADGLTDYDIQFGSDTSLMTLSADSVLPEAAFLNSEALANFSKSGTTDDVIRPFNVDNISKQRTNYGLWNAVIRVDLSQFAGSKSTAPEVADLTVACVGECNTKFTGERDGKTLHKFLTAGLLHKAGIPVKNGYFHRYEQYILKNTPISENCGAFVDTIDSGSTITNERIKIFNLESGQIPENIGD